IHTRLCLQVTKEVSKTIIRSKIRAIRDDVLEEVDVRKLQLAVTNSLGCSRNLLHLLRQLTKCLTSRDYLLKRCEIARTNGVRKSLRKLQPDMVGLLQQF